MWSLIAILVSVQTGSPEEVEVTRNLPSSSVCSDLMQERKARGTKEGHELYLVCIPAPANKDQQTRSKKV